MLQKIPGIEPAHLQNVKDQTAKQVVRGSKEIRVTDREKEKREKEWILPGDREELANLLEEVNEEMERDGHPLRFSLVQVEDKWFVEVWDLSEKRAIQLMSITEAGKALAKSVKKQGFLIDKKI